MEFLESDVSVGRSRDVALVRELEQAGNCAHPVRLAGESIDLRTGEVRSRRLKVVCKDRRALLCPSCSSLYQADAWIQVALGLNGGKNVPESVRTHPRLFVTLTAPSFGPVHRRTPSGRCHLVPAGTWYFRTSTPLSLVSRGRQFDSRRPLRVSCYDLRAAVLLERPECSTVESHRARDAAATRSSGAPTRLAIF
jgi:hypothetical protein